VDGGLALTLAATAVPGLGLRFGPRGWLGHGYVVDDGADAASRRSEDVQVGLGVLVGVRAALAPGTQLLVDGEVGSSLHGLALDTSAGRSGFLGAYWEANAGLAWAPSRSDSRRWRALAQGVGSPAGKQTIVRPSSTR
jgi:fermentation-respiration switch protein FrsA (DUF1100 family)